MVNPAFGGSAKVHHQTLQDTRLKVAPDTWGLKGMSTRTLEFTCHLEGYQE